MSDILIRGMEMPKSCADCFLEDPYDGYNCRIIPKSANWGLGERPSWCPLVEVPTPHGRLIDADALETDLKRQCKEVFRTDAVSPDDYWITRNQAYNENLWKTWCESFYDYLKTRPIIIPTEDGET